MSKYGLHKRPSYEQIVNYIQSDPVIARYPNREATILMNSPQLQNLSNEGSIDLQKQSENLSKQKQKEELVKGSMTPGQTFKIFTPRAPGQKSSSSGGSDFDSAVSDEDKSDAEGDITMGVAYAGFQREMQRQQAAGTGSLLLGTIQQSPEAAAAAAAASGSVQHQPFIPGLNKDPTAAAAALVPKKRTEAAPAAASASASASAPNPLNPFVNPNTIPSFSPDMARFIENVMTASRQMPTTPARPPGQDLLITYLPQQRQTPLALPNQPQKRRSEEKQGGHPPKTLLLQAEEEEEPKLAKGSADIVKTKGKVQEVHVAAKKLTSHNYNTWEALTPLQLEEQLTKYYGYRRKWDLKNANRHKTKMLEFAEKVVPLRRSKATPQDS